jgi:thioredoxin-related protein
VNRKHIRIVLTVVFAFSFFAFSSAGAAQWGSVTEALEHARLSGKPILIKFESDNCSACDKLDSRTLADPLVTSLLEDFETAHVDVYDTTTTAIYNNTEYTYRELTKLFKIKARPTSLFLHCDGAVIESVGGFIPKQTYAEILRNVLTLSSAHTQQE